ncbi:methyltransferase domain-containing protein [Chloroflexota bacterium]
MTTATTPIIAMDAREMENAPGHWLLARMGKKVLRPGGKKLTEKMIQALAITDKDDVIEFAPGLGFTANLALTHRPHSYVGVERDENAAKEARSFISASAGNNLVVVGNAEQTELPDSCGSVVYGEAMLTMQADNRKINIIREALRLLKKGGRYGIHELCLQPDELSDELKARIQKELAQSIRVNARPLTIAEWRALFIEQGFTIESTFTAPMHLLHTARIIEDEGLARTVQIGYNILRYPAARKRILEMKSVFDSYANHLGAISIIAVKN